MNKERVKGAIDESLGSAKREAGELAGLSDLQLEGIAQQVKGKLESAWGKAEDVVHEANNEAEVQPRIPYRGGNGMFGSREQKRHCQIDFGQAAPELGRPRLNAPYPLGSL